MLQTDLIVANQRSHRARILSRAWPVALASASGILCRCAGDLNPRLPVGLLCWALLIVAIHGKTWRQAAALGLIQGVVAEGLGFHWVASGLHRVLEFSLLKAVSITAALILFQGGRAAFIAASYSLGSRRGWSPLLAFPLALVSCELIYPFVFPWYTGYFALARDEWSQLAEFGGPFLLSAWVAAVNAGLASAWLGRSQGWRRVLVALAWSFSILGAVTAFGHTRVRDIDARGALAPEARIGVVQGNLGPARRETRDPVSVYRAASLELLRREPNLDLFVWPETAIYFPISEKKLSSFFRDRVRHGADPREGDFSAPLLTGLSLAHDPAPCPSKFCAATGVTKFTNSAVLATKTGRIAGQYDKRSLVPIGESSFLPRWLAPQEPSSTAFSSGSDDSSIALAEHRLAVSICYEDILHGRFRDAVNHANPDLLINLTSDSWFRGSPASRLHLALARLRAVEHRRFLLRATTTGTTSLVAPTGRVVWSLPLDQLASGVVSVHWLHSNTLYEQVGDCPYYLAALALVCCMLIGRRSRESFASAALTLEPTANS